MRRRLNLLALAAAAALAPAFAFAEAEPAPQAQSDQPIYAADEAGPTNGLSLNGAFTNTLTTAYITRGVLLENQGVIYQNVGELYFKLLDEPKVTAIVGMFNSIHDEATDAGVAEGGLDRTSVTKWYEFDWWAGGSVALTPEIGVSLLYQEFHSPNGGFGSCKNVQIKGTYSDAATPWGEKGFALNPYALAFYELDGKAGTGSDEGLYIEVGIAPSFALVKDGKYPVTLSIPISAGFGFDDFYEDDDHFGYVAGGVALSAPLAFIPAKYGAWTGSVGVSYYYYGDGVDDFNEGNDKSGADGIIVGSASVALSF